MGKVSISEDDVSNIKAEVDALINFNLESGEVSPKIFLSLGEYAMRLATKKIPPEVLSGHGPNNEPMILNECQLEYKMWAIAIASIIWLNETQKQKAKDGHCYVHPKPCAEGRAFYQRINKDFRLSIISLVESYLANDK